VHAECVKKIAARLAPHDVVIVLPRLMGPREVVGFLELDRTEARTLRRTETTDHEGRPVTGATFTTTSWRPQWGRYASGDALLVLAKGERLVDANGSKTGFRGRALSARSLQVLVLDRLRLIPFAGSKGAPRFLSAEDHALVSLLGGSWPRIKVTKTTTARDVLRAEVAAFDLAMRRHKLVPPAAPVFDDFAGTDEKKIRWETPRLNRGKRGLPRRPT
jgi:hypothetical protein